MLNIIEIILNLIYPPVCGFCKKFNDEFLCKKCITKFNMMKISKIDDYCKEPVFFDEHYYMFQYKDEIREHIIDYKFNEKSYMYKSFAKLITQDMNFMEKFINKYDFIISVPIHKKRYKKRGYNQSELIAKEIAKICDKPYKNNILIKNKNIVPQSSLDKMDRIKNIKNAFSLDESIFDISNKKIAIFDDIFTTGATANECAKILKSAGAETIGIFTIAKTFYEI